MTSHSVERVLGPLLPGTEVGPWRLVNHQGEGANGYVYQAESVDGAKQGVFALKLATLPGDERFAREVALLSRIHHPGVPRLRDSGVWTFPTGALLPYLVMDWVDGVTLYEWAAQSQRTSRQVLRVLAQLARTLEAVHQAGCVHRDVKGDNVLVSPEGRAFLMDFGAGKYRGARPLTDEWLPPGTVHYRSPQAQHFLWAYRLRRGISYEHTEADDVYALGVTAYRVVTGLYPPSGFDLARAVDPAFPPQPARQPPRKLATVSRELDALILRMLSAAPEARGSAGELAQALEHAAERAGAKADVPVMLRARKTGSTRRMRPRLVLAALGAAAALGGAVVIISSALAVRSQGQQDAGAKVALGDSTPRVPEAPASPPEQPQGIGLDMPTKPFPGQVLPPCKGVEVEIELTPGRKDTRSCWLKVDATAEKCRENGYEHRGGCYRPSYPHPPTKVPRSIGP